MHAKIGLHMRTLGERGYPGCSLFNGFAILLIQLAPELTHQVLVLFLGFSPLLGLTKVKILTAVTGWDKFLHLLHIFGLLRWDTTHL